MDLLVHIIGQIILDALNTTQADYALCGPA